jgi:hypothetical protein
LQQSGKLTMRRIENELTFADMTRKLSCGCYEDRITHKITIRCNHHAQPKAEDRQESIAELEEKYCHIIARAQEAHGMHWFERERQLRGEADEIRKKTEQIKREPNKCNQPQ